MTPLAFQGDPAKWADMLDAVADLADTIVPGHGPVGGEPRCASSRPTCGPASTPTATRARSRPARGTRGPSASRDAINIERAALLAEGRDEMPPSMLKAIGFG